MDSNSDGTPNYLENSSTGGRPQPDPAKIRITNNDADQLNPEIYGNFIVWEDERNSNFDIYLYDLSVDTDSDDIPNFLDGDRPQPDPAEKQLSNNPSHQENPAIYGSKVVWVDKRNGNKDIFIYDIISGEENILAGHEETGDPKFRPRQDIPRIYGDKVVWVDDKFSLGSWEISMYNLSVDTDSDGVPNYLDSDRPEPDPAEERLTSTSESENSPSIYGNKIVFTRSDNITLYDIGSGSEHQLTDSTALQEIDGGYCRIHGSKVVWVYNIGSKDIYLYDLAMDTDTDGTPNYIDPDTPSPDPAVNRVTNESEPISMLPEIFTNMIVWHDSRNSERDTYLFNLTDNLPPQITNSIPDYTSEIRDNESVNFQVSVSDFENDALTYTWFLNNRLIQGETLAHFEFIADPNSTGEFQVKVMVSDGEYSVETIWLLTVLESNVEAPTFAELEPATDPTIIEGGELLLSFRATDEDSEFLEVTFHIGDPSQNASGFYTYYSSHEDNFEATGELYFSPYLDHKGTLGNSLVNITVNVSDGKFTAVHSWTITTQYVDDVDMDGYNDSIEVTWGSDPQNTSSTPPDLDGDLIVDADDDDKDGDGVLDKDDAYPLDPTRSKDEDTDYTLEILIVIISIVLIIVVLIIIPRILKRRK
jgi:beta propeller repeat protein